MAHLAAYLPGNSTVELRPFAIPEAGHGQVVIETKCSAICGSDIRCIYHQHLGTGPERYRNVVAGHEPAGRIVSCGPGLKRFREGDRVLLYHISGCGVCHDCRQGYMISCRSDQRAAYGWQRDGGMAPYILAEEKDLVLLPDDLSYEDGAQVACGFGTVYEALVRMAVSGLDTVLVTGLGPVGLGALMLAKAMGAQRLIGVDVNPTRCDLALRMGLATDVISFGAHALNAVLDLTNGRGVQKALDCSGRGEARQLCVRATMSRGVVGLVGEGGEMTLAPSPDVIHGNKTLLGSWVTSIWRMEELVERLANWKIHPHVLITDRFSLRDVADAYAVMVRGNSGKVVVTFGNSGQFLPEQVQLFQPGSGNSNLCERGLRGDVRRPTGMRKSFEGLAGIVQALALGMLTDGDVYLFCNRTRVRIKAPYWDGSSLWCCAKRLESGRFGWMPTVKKERVVLSEEEF